RARRSHRRGRRFESSTAHCRSPVASSTLGREVACWHRSWFVECAAVTDTSVRLLRAATFPGGSGVVHKKVVGLLVAGMLVGAACSSGGSGSGSSSGSKGPTSSITPRTAADQGTPDPAGVLRYGVDLTQGFGDNFDPGALSNGCAYQELSLIQQSVTSPS